MTTQTHDNADPRAHWDGVYTRKRDDEVSWFQRTPAVSLSWIRKLDLPADAPILDVGGGASRLVDHLRAVGYSALTVLDISEAGLAATRARLGAAAARVDWLVADAADWTPPKLYRVWHDRAVFHFLTDPGRRQGYLDALRRRGRGRRQLHRGHLRPGRSGALQRSTCAAVRRRRSGRAAGRRLAPDRDHAGGAHHARRQRPAVHLVPLPAPVTVTVRRARRARFAGTAPGSRSSRRPRPFRSRLRPAPSGW